MRAMILAAGLGKRMLPLTSTIPKPLLKVAGKSLIEHQINRLVAAGITDIVINHFHLGQLIVEALGSGERFGASISYSAESIRLETAGGIIKSLPKLKDDSFVVINSDIWIDYPFEKLKPLGNGDLAHLLMVRNAAHNPQGDFYLNSAGRLQDQADTDTERLTYSGISVLHKDLFAGYPVQPLPLRPLFKQAISGGQASGEYYPGLWIDIGTPQRLQEVNDLVMKRT